MDVKSFEPQTTQAPKTKKKALVFQAQAPVQPNPADYQPRRADAQKKTAKFQSQAPVSANAADYQTAKSGKTGSARTLNFQPQAPVKNNAEPDTMSHPAIQSRVPQMPAPLTRTKNQNPDPLSSVPAHSRPQAAAAALPAQPACFICGK